MAAPPVDIQCSSKHSFSSDSRHKCVRKKIFIREYFEPPYEEFFTVSNPFNNFLDNLSQSLLEKIHPPFLCPISASLSPSFVLVSYSNPFSPSSNNVE
jgi:hypothetical protein